MEIRLTYDEISDLIEKKAGRRLPVNYGGDSHTVRIAYDVMSTSVGLDLTVESVTGSDIIVSHSGGMAVGFMIKQALKMAKSRPGGDMIDYTGDGRIHIALGRNPQAGSLLDHASLNDIRFDEHYAIVDFTPNL